MTVLYNIAQKMAVFVSDDLNSGQNIIEARPLFNDPATGMIIDPVAGHPGKYTIHNVFKNRWFKTTTNLLNGDPIVDSLDRFAFNVQMYGFEQPTPGIWRIRADTGQYLFVSNDEKSYNVVETHDDDGDDRNDFMLLDPWNPPAEGEKLDPGPILLFCAPKVLTVYISGNAESGYHVCEGHDPEGLVGDDLWTVSQDQEDPALFSFSNGSSYFMATNLRRRSGEDPLVVGGGRLDKPANQWKIGIDGGHWYLQSAMNSQYAYVSDDSFGVIRGKNMVETKTSKYGAAQFQLYKIRQRLP